ncbi:NUDIX hydrolase [Actinospica sp. MGRD01-02]|uniref:NUDIX hydrolase n=1 Tax=Actinospica acidithermotolerans TaxID=2828514 RepID=A0A941EA67_9ACTN|nr:NUDIX hydrolase [Actinospica acidithermotolerans]MBR7827791.1 NUDIX hydrolase [Actinospica acidithermotolerans]
MSLIDDLLAEGEPEREFNPGIAARLPRKRVAAGALFRDTDGRLLMVETTYKPTLEIPGGLAENGESPYDACTREVREELGIEPAIGDLLVADWVPAHGPWPDGLMLVFDGGILPEEHQSRIELRDGEISACWFLTLEQIEPRVKPSFHRRLAACVQAVKAGHPQYLQFGRPLAGHSSSSRL